MPPSTWAGGVCGGYSRGRGCVAAVSAGGADWRDGASVERVAALRRQEKGWVDEFYSGSPLPAQLKDAATVRSYILTAAGRILLDAHPEVLAKHSKKDS